VFRVRADRFDNEVEFIGAVDLARYAVGHAGPDELGFGEVIEPVDPLRIAVLHEEHGIRRVSGRADRFLRRAAHLGVEFATEPSLMMPGIIISSIFSEQGRLVFRATPLQD